MNQWSSRSLTFRTQHLLLVHYISSNVLASLTESLTFLFSLETHHRPVAAYQRVDIPSRICLHESFFMLTKLAKPRSLHLRLHREVANPFHVGWARPPLNIPLTVLSAFHGCCAYQKLRISSFLSTWLLCHCVVLKCQNNSKMADCQICSWVWAHCYTRCIWSPGKSFWQ